MTIEMHQSHSSRNLTAMDLFFISVVHWRDYNAHKQQEASENIDNAFSRAAILSAEFDYLRCVRSQQLANKILRNRFGVEMALNTSMIGKSRKLPSDIHNDWSTLLVSLGEDPTMDVNDYSLVVLTLHEAMDEEHHG